MFLFGTISVESLLLAGLLSLLYTASIAIYNIYFSPIAHFPGPKIAAVSFWYGVSHINCVPDFPLI